jgi:exoribonuclease II
MHVLFEDSGKFHIARVMSEAPSSLQAEMESGKRVKLKLAQVMLRVDSFAPGLSPTSLLDKARTLALEIDLDLAWQFSPEGDFSFVELARDYFSAQASLLEQAAMLLKLFEAPHYFRRLGKGIFKKASEDVVKAALLGLERKRQLVLQIEGWADELVAGTCPAPIAEQLYKILFKPDKNSAEYKAVVDAAKRSQRAPLDLLKAAGAITSPYQFHWRRFLFEQFPNGYGFAAIEAPAIKDELPLALVQAFSIDDSSTTEIDDALSVQGLGSGCVSFGVHIAAPGLAMQPEAALDQIARSRFSTVYMPGFKLTMLPDEVVQAYTLMAGRNCPAVSIYARFDEASLELLGCETRLEQVPIAANLRHDKLDTVVTQASLTGEAAADYSFAPELAFAFRLANHLKAQREIARGKPETFNRPDYSFALEKPSDQEPMGNEAVQISTRKRGEPLDLIVAEAMILANSQWGAWLAECKVPGIYRSQASMQPGVKVRMGTKPAPHAGMGVAQYTWATSPLRRYVDLVNQWQIIACARHGHAAALAAPFKPKDVALFAIISGFESAYADYNAFQSSIERYWTLLYLTQNQIDTLDVAVIKPPQGGSCVVRAETLPLVFNVMNAGADWPRGARLRVKVGGTDLLTLDIHASVLERLDEVLSTEENVNDCAEPDDDGDESAASAGPLALAIDVSESAEEGGAAVDTPAAEAAPSPSAT